MNALSAVDRSDRGVGGGYWIRKSAVWTEIRATRLSRIAKELQRDGRVGVSVDGNFVVLIHKQLL